MRPVRKISAKEENIRLEPIAGTHAALIKRDPIEPEPVGTIVLMAFRITGYDRDCDGSLMARIEQVDKDCECTGWDTTHIGIRPSTCLKVNETELKSLFTRRAETHEKG